MDRPPSCAQLADVLAVRLQQALQGVPDRFLDTFEFTATGQNLTHPIILGALSRLAWDLLPGVRFVGIDVRLNRGGGVKFQPDVVAFDGQLGHLLFLDYESPNSSDARIPRKDIDAYCAWTQLSGEAVPYIIITTLPDCESPRWELRYTSPGHCNEQFRHRERDVCQNPFRFWYAHYRSLLAGRNIGQVASVNISGKHVARVIPS